MSEPIVKYMSLICGHDLGDTGQAAKCGAIQGPIAVSICWIAIFARSIRFIDLTFVVSGIAFVHRESPSCPPAWKRVPLGCVRLDRSGCSMRRRGSTMMHGLMHGLSQVPFLS